MTTLAINKRHRNARVLGVTEYCSSDVPLLNPDQQFFDTSPSTCSQIECPPNTSEENISIQAPLQQLPLEAPPPTPNSECTSEQLTLSLSLVQRRCNTYNFSLPLRPETPTANSFDEEPLPHEKDKPLTLVRRRSSPVSFPLASRSSAEDYPTLPQPFLPEISFPSPIDEDQPECHLSLTPVKRRDSLS